MILISIGWYIPGVVLSYCIIMSLLLWPYIEHHQLHFKIFGYLAITIAKVINKAVRWVAQMKEYAEDDTDIGTTVAALDDGFENDLGSKRQLLVQISGPSPIHGELMSTMQCIHL